MALQAGRGSKRNEFVHEDEEADREHHGHRRDPAAHLGGFYFFLVSKNGRGVAAALLSRRSHRFLAMLSGVLFRTEGRHENVDGELGSAESELHRLAQRDQPANKRPGHPVMFIRGAQQRLRMNDNLSQSAGVRFRALWLAHGNTPGVRRAHHYALKDGLAANQSLLLGGRKGGQELLRS